MPITWSYSVLVKDLEEILGRYNDEYSRIFVKTDVVTVKEDLLTAIERLLEKTAPDEFYSCSTISRQRIKNFMEDQIHIFEESLKVISRLF